MADSLSANISRQALESLAFLFSALRPTHKATHDRVKEEPKQSFYTFGQIIHTTPQSFLVIASAVPVHGSEGTVVRTETLVSLQAAQQRLPNLLAEIGAALNDQGAIVVQVET